MDFAKVEARVLLGLQEDIDLAYRRALYGGSVTGFKDYKRDVEDLKRYCQEDVVREYNCRCALKTFVPLATEDEGHLLVL